MLYSVQNKNKTHGRFSLKRKNLIFISLILYILLLTSCDNIQKYSSDEEDTYHIKSFHSGGERSVSGKIEKISTMNMLGSERIVLTISPDDKTQDALPYYELEFSDEDREDFTFTVYSVTTEDTSSVNEGDFDLLESLSVSNSDGNVIIKADCDDSLKFRVEENADAMQLTVHIKEISLPEK